MTLQFHFPIPGRKSGKIAHNTAMKQIFGNLRREKTQYHPPAPPVPGAVSGEALEAMFADCADYNTRTIRVGGGNGALSAQLVSLDGMVDGDEVTEGVLRPLTDEARFGNVKTSAEAAALLAEGLGYYYSAKVRHLLSDCAEDLLNGWCAVVFDGVAVTFETKNTAGRGVEKPEQEKMVKGGKEAFTERIRMNTVLLRRRLRTSELKIKELSLGRRSRTKAAVIYIEGLTNETVVAEVTERLSAIDVDGALTAGTIEEYLLPRRSPFPQLTLTERPDRFAMELLQGRAGILADGIPLGFLTQATLAQQLKVPEDGTGHWLIASLLTLLRWAAMLVSVLLPAVYVAITMYHQEMIPTKLMLSIIQSKQDVPFSTAAETLGMLIAFELLQEAGLRLPESIGETVSIIGALIVGQSAVEAKVISPVVVIVVAVAGITGYTMPNQDLAAALRLCRFGLVLLSLAMGLFGIVAGSTLILYYLCTLESFGTPYLSPFCDGRGGETLRALLRFPLRRNKERPECLHPENVRNQK